MVDTGTARFKVLVLNQISANGLKRLPAERTRIASGSVTSLPTWYCSGGRRFKPEAAIWFNTSTR